MTSSAQPSSQPAYADRVYRSGTGIGSGVMLLVLALWVGGDAVLRGAGRTPWLALAGLVAVVPLVVAFTARPAVFAGADHLRVRNPFRMITVPWAEVEDVRARYTAEVFTRGGRRFSLYAVPVSLRQRKRAGRRQLRSGPGERQDRMSALAEDSGPLAGASADRTVAELRTLAEQSASRPTAQGGTAIRWAYEVFVPVAAGLAALLVILVTG